MSEECSVDVMLLNHDPPEELGECICQSGDEGSCVYLSVRDALCLNYFGMLMSCIIVTVIHKEMKLYLFFDFWVQSLLLISSEFGMYGVVNLLFYTDYYDFWDSVPWYCKMHWALFSAALPSAIVSCVLFWTDVFYKDIHKLRLFMNIISPILAIFEFSIISFPLRLLHFFYFVLFYAIYVCFTLGYQKLGGTGADESDYLYSIVDWEEPKKACLNCLIGLAIGLGSYIIFCFLSMAKLGLKQRSDYY